MDKKKEDKKKKQKQVYVMITIAVILALGVIILALMLINQKNNDEEKNMAYTELINQINEETVESLEMTVGSTSVKVKLKNEEEEKTVILPNTQAFIELLHQKAEQGKEIKLTQKPKNVFLSIPTALFSILPTLLMLAVVILIIQMQGLGDKGKVYDGEENKSKVRFKDIAGLEEEKKELEEVVDFLKEPKRFYDMGAKIPKGILLYGKPGTGKTLIAKAIAGEAGVPFISMSGSEFIEMFAGLRCISCT